MLLKLVLSLLSVIENPKDVVDGRARRFGVDELCLAFTLLCHPCSDFLTFSDTTVFLNFAPICNKKISNLFRTEN